MNLARINRNTSRTKCLIRSACREESDRNYFDRLFALEWKEFVVKKDSNTGKLGWTTGPGESPTAGIRYDSKFTAASCC